MTPYVGVDVADIERFRQFRRQKDNRLLQKIFTPSELRYCFASEDPAPRLATRFAAKEAVVKALSSAGTKGVSFREIEVKRCRDGTPTIVLRIKGAKQGLVRISLSHARRFAIAFAVVIKAQRLS